MELILRDFEDVECYWTVKKRKEIKSMLDYYGLEDLSVCNVSKCNGWVSQLGNDRKQKSIDAFKAGCEISAALGCDIVNFVSPWPDTITAPNSYLPEYYYINVPGVDPRIRALQVFQTKLKYRFPKPFEWEKYWESHVDAVRTVTKIAGSYGLNLQLKITRIQ